MDLMVLRVFSNLSNSLILFVESDGRRAPERSNKQSPLGSGGMRVFAATPEVPSGERQRSPSLKRMNTN